MPYDSSYTNNKKTTLNQNVMLLFFVVSLFFST